MISSIKGILKETGQSWVKIELHGLTIQVNVPPSLANDLDATGREVILHTKLIMKEDEPQIYGFPTESSLKFFNMVTGVSGIGPRTALNLLSVRTINELTNAILSESLDAFVGIPGIGRKSAARIILELKGRLEKESLSLPLSPEHETDSHAVSALTALGYSISEARGALSQVKPSSESGLEEKVRLALVHLGGPN
jgi:Holliday junction DNA helicase RuvA